MTSFCFFVQLADRTLILKQKEFFVFIIATRLFLNHSPSEWFSFIQKALCRVQYAAQGFPMSHFRYSSKNAFSFSNGITSI